MSDTLPIILVTPVWNDSRRLVVFGFSLAEALQQSGLPVRWIVSDDGSSLEEKKSLETLVARLAEVYPNVELILSDVRSRKGGAVYRAWDHCEEAQVLAFVDADGAISAESIVNLLRVSAAESSETAVIGVRSNSSGLPIRRSFGRTVSFNLFRMIVSLLLGVRFQDTQCGAKIIPAKAYREVRGRLLEHGFIFDVELLVALKELSIDVLEQPIPWQEVDGGKVSPLRDSWAMLSALMRVRKRLKSGHYEKS
ncbi:MAG: glycosyltransferase [Opitutaceae bacterium]